MIKLALFLSLAASLAAAQRVPVWTLSARPTLDIGDEANTQTQFNGVNGILRMRGGELVVANGMSQELRVFSPTGAYLRTLTSPERRDGMRALGRIWQGGDTIYAAEILPTESSVWVFTLSGFVAKRPVGAINAGGIYPIDRFSDGRFLISATPRRAGRSMRSTAYTDSLPLGVLSLSDLANPRWIGAIVTDMIMAITAVAGGRGGRGSTVTPIPHPFRRSVMAAVSGDRLWIADTETGTITQRSANGRGLAVFSAPGAPRQLDTAAIRALRNSADWDTRMRLQNVYALSLPEFAPRLAALLPGVNGEMWIRAFDEDPSRPARYTVLSRTGSAIGRVDLPSGFTVLNIGVEALLGVQVDIDGLEHIVRYSLRRSP
jgi:hypothetical protein